MNQLTRSVGFLTLALLANPVEAQQWEGFHVGLHAAYSRATGSTLAEGRVLEVVTPQGSDFQTTKVLFQDRRGAIGLQSGYSWQNGSAVFGLEGDIARLSVDDHASLPVRTFAGTVVPLAYLRTSQELKWLGTVRARVGFTPSPNWLTYATAGIAVADVAYAADTDFSETNGYEWHYPAAHSKVRTGLAVGAGVEWAFAENLRARLEYLNCNLGRRTQVAKNKPVPAYPADVQYTWNTRMDFLRLALNYRF
jgi:outer membrane immunogenic protein